MEICWLELFYLSFRAGDIDFFCSCPYFITYSCGHSVFGHVLLPLFRILEDFLKMRMNFNMCDELSTSFRGGVMRLRGFRTLTSNISTLFFYFNPSHFIKVVDTHIPVLSLFCLEMILISRGGLMMNFDDEGVGDDGGVCGLEKEARLLAILFSGLLVLHFFRSTCISFIVYTVLFVCTSLPLHLPSSSGCLPFAANLHPHSELVEKDS